MISRTKYNIDGASIKKLFDYAGIGEVTDISPLGAGDYNAVFSAKAGGKEYAVKIAPTADVPVLTYEKNMMASEVYWYKQMKERTSITVPEIYYTDFGKERVPADYFIMEKLPGSQMDKMDFSEAERAEAESKKAEMAAQIHKIWNDKFGYIQNGLFENWHQAIGAMVRSLLCDCSSIGRKSKYGEKLLMFTDKYETVLKDAECSMVNFDIWPANIICKRENGDIIYAWIDPERSFWGDRIVDFVCLEWGAPLEEKKKSLSAYNSVAYKPITATKSEKIRYAVAQGYLGLIMETEKYFRYTPFHYGWWRNVKVCESLFKEAFEVLENG